MKSDQPMCLKCDKLFPSKGIHNRICKKCKKRPKGPCMVEDHGRTPSNKAILRLENGEIVNLNAVIE